MELGREKKRKYYCPDGADDLEVEEQDQSLLLTKLTDQELKLKQERAERALPLLEFKDGGAKFRAQLNRVRFEMKRRGLLPPKEGDTCVNDIPVAVSSNCSAIAEGLSAGAPLIVPDSDATCSFRAVGDMDDKTIHEETRTFRKNFFTMKSCNHKNANVNGDPPSQLTDDIGSSPRKTSLKTGSHVPVNIDESSESNCEHAGDISSTSHPYQDPAGLLMMKSKAPHLRPRRSRRNNKPVVLVDEEELEDRLTYQVEEVGTSVKEGRIYYPSSDDPKAVEISHSDMECLDPEAYLSSPIMNFYIKYLQKTTSLTTRKGCSYQIFNTYFYKKLQLDVLKKIDKETSFEKFRRWWKGINLFEKAYILIPIHECNHWSLVIICIPDKEDESGIIILHLDSLGVHSSSSICKDVKSFLIEEWNYLKKKRVADPPVAEKLWDKLSRRITMEITEVPQQKNEYDCGLFVLFFMERFLGEAPERMKMKGNKMFGSQWFKPEEASNLRLKIKDLLTEEFAKASNEVTCNSDS